ncbi:MAG TPA: HAMP domain-containing sensor histidine kinase [Gemmatimonadaceae bacterium]|nr:HAMP domain-containing sensor histidine kinase [Gemmatimonadaceae bacterium]
MTAAEEEYWLRSFPLTEASGRDFSSALGRPDALDLVVEIAHDFRSPLASVLVLAEMLESGRSGPLNPRQRAQVQLIHAAVRALCSTTTDVMDLARSGHADALGARAPFDVDAVLAAVRDTLRPVASAKGLTLRVAAAAVGRRVGYARALERVLLNLTTNALKFTDEGHVELSVHAAADDPSSLLFAVQDTGRGISPRSAHALLDAFPTPTAERPRGFSGAGLGLAICRQLLDAMGTTLLLDSRPGEGSRFHFALALPQAAAASADA